MLKEKDFQNIFILRSFQETLSLSFDEQKAW